MTYLHIDDVLPDSGFQRLSFTQGVWPGSDPARPLTAASLLALSVLVFPHLQSGTDHSSNKAIRSSGGGHTLRTVVGRDQARNKPQLFLVVRGLPDELPLSQFTDLEAEARGHFCKFTPLNRGLACKLWSEPRH